MLFGRYLNDESHFTVSRCITLSYSQAPCNRSAWGVIKMIVVITQLDDDTRTLTTFEQSSLGINTQALISLSDLMQIPYEKLIFILPGKHIRLLSVKVPASLSQHDLQHAVPNILEESFSEDIQSLHFSIGPDNAEHKRLIGVMKKTLWKNLLHELALHDLRPDLILPDYLAIPYKAGSWSLYYNDDTVIVRTDLNNGFSTEPDLIKTLLTLRFSESVTKPDRLDVTQNPNSNIELSIALPIPLEKSTHTFEKIIQPHELLNHPTFNMLQSSLPKKQSKKTRSYWQWCGFAFASFIAFVFLTQLILYIDLRIQSSLTQRQITALSTQFSHNQVPITSQWDIEQLLKKYERDPNPFMLLLEKIAPVLSHSKEIQLSSINYDDKKITLTLLSAQGNAFNSFNSALSQAGLNLSQIKTEVSHDSTSEILSVGEK